MKFFLGVDLAKDSFVAVLIGLTGDVIWRDTFSNTLAGFKKLVARLDEPSLTVVMCEPTGVYGKRFQHALAAVVGSLHEMNAQSLRRFSFSQVQTKTDEADAMSIAQAARTLFLTRAELLEKSRIVPDPARENLALWLAEYDRLRAATVALRNQIKSLGYHTAADACLVRQRRESEFHLLKKRQKQVLLRIIKLYHQLDDGQAHLLESIPGIGPLATAATLAIVGNLDRFASVDSLKGYLGAYPARHQSGHREGAAHMAHHGNRLLRHILWNCAKAAIWHKHPQNPFRALYDRLITKGKPYASAIGAVMRKLVQTIYGVLKTQTPFKYPSPT